MRPTHARGVVKALWGPRSRSILAAGLLVVAAGAIAVLALRERAAGVPPLEILLPTPTAVPNIVVVHLAGQVARPGVYSFPAGTRLHEAIDAAGGPTADAELDALNQAQPIRDGQRYLIPRRGEIASAPAASQLLDLNLASAQDLERLDGIGEELARRIVAYRQEHGPYRRVEDLLAVQGIGTTLLQRLRSQVTVQ